MRGWERFATTVASAYAVDSNVLLDLVTSDPQWARWSAEAIERLADSSRLVINAVIHADVSVQYDLTEELDAVLPNDIFQREALPFEAAFLAGKGLSLYRLPGGARRSPLPDFVFGAHAALSGYRLPTRDAARYRSSPTLNVIEPG